MSMYVCRRTPSETDPNGSSVVLELTPQVLDDMCSTFPVVHSEDELLRNLQQGVELRSPMTGIVWFRVAKPLTYTPKPTVCQITNTPLKDVMYDGKTRQGPGRACPKKAGSVSAADALASAMPRSIAAMKTATSTCRKACKRLPGLCARRPS